MGYELLPYLHVNRLTCYCFMDTRKDIGLLGLRQSTSLLMAKAVGGASYWVCASSHAPKSLEDDAGPMMDDVCTYSRLPLMKRILSLGNSSFYSEL